MTESTDPLLLQKARAMCAIGLGDWPDVSKLSVKALLIWVQKMGNVIAMPGPKLQLAYRDAFQQIQSNQGSIRDASGPHPRYSSPEMG